MPSSPGLALGSPDFPWNIYATTTWAYLTTGNVIINGTTPGYGLQISGTNSPFRLNTPDNNSNFQIGMGNGTNPILYSSTGTIETAAGGGNVLINGGATGNALTIKGSVAPVEIYSPDGTRNFQIGTANGTNPQLYSSTGVVDVASALTCFPNLIIYSLDKSRNLNLSVPNSGNATITFSTAAQGLLFSGGAWLGSNAAQGLIAFSPDVTRYLQTSCANGADPQLYSSTGTISTNGTNLVINGGATGNGLWVKGTVSPFRLDTADATNYFSIGMGNSPNNFPNFYSNVGGIRFSIGTNAIQVSGGYACKAGVSAGTYGNTFNFNYSSPNLQAWIDTTNLGNLTICDARVKRDVEDLPPTLELVNRLRPVTYGMRHIEDDIWRDDGRRHIGFLGHEAQDIEASLVNGFRHELTVDGKIQPQTLNLLDLCAMLTKAVQELTQRVAELESKLYGKQN